jgi:ATP-dependent Clp protease ATP-binding subunit ClpC
VNGFNFTERTRKVLNLAREEAGRLHHEYVGTEHLLLGLIREGEGIAIRVLENLKADSALIRKTIEDTIQTGRSPGTAQPDLPYTSRAKKCLELAMHEARELSHNYVGTEHLLLGLLREEKGIAAQVLVQAGLSIESARAEVRRLLGNRESSDTSSADQVISVNVEVKYADGVTRRGEFQGLQGAIDFLMRK